MHTRLLYVTDLLISRAFPISGFCTFLFSRRGFPDGSVVKNLPAMQETLETQVGSLGGEDPLELEMVTHSRTLAWKIPWTEKPSRLQSMGLQRVRYDLAGVRARAHTHTHTHTEL